jgi:microcystin-dependent protein
MSEPFLGQIMMMGFNFAPRSFAKCDGQILPINQNQSLFSLLGTQYGGDGRTSFALPDLRGRTPISYAASNPPIGQKGGEENQTLSAGQIPAHTHTAHGSTAAGNAKNPRGALYATTDAAIYGSGPTVALNAQTIGQGGGGQAHANMQPYLAINFCIALQGLFPSRN